MSPVGLLSAFQIIGVIIFQNVLDSPFDDGLLYKESLNILNSITLILSQTYQEEHILMVFLLRV